MRKHQAHGIRVRGRVLFGVLLAMAALVPPAAQAQYFGRNKVEYTDFDFRILATEHFDLYYYEREERAARIAAQLAERWYARISRVLHHRLDRRQPLVVYGSQAEFSQTNVVGGLVPDSVGGVTESARRRIVMPFAPTMAETDRVLGHELVHAFQFDIARRTGGTGQPLWFIEGMAEYLARGSADAESSLWLRDAVRSDRIPRKQGDAARRLSPYQYGHAFWSYLGGRFGDEVVEKALKPDKKHRRLADRMRYATGLDLDTLHADWRADVYQRYAPAPDAERIEPWGRQGMQAGPSLSPDGRRAVFFSERDRLSIDLFLADVDSGRVVRKLATTAATARFDSLQPLRSAGAWSPEGDWFAFPAVRQGHATLTLLPMRDGATARELAFERLGHILTASWSPDGKSIAVSALAGGFADLYVYDLTTGRLRQLTDDATADLQPAWSRDGRTIAFVTERYSSDVAELRFGRPQLALLDVQSRRVRQVHVGDSLAQLSPAWSGHDDTLYFVADRDGTTNVFRTTLESRGDTPAVATSALEQLTRVPTGVAGLTPSSPALSASGGASRVAYTVYDDGRPQLVVFDGADTVARVRSEPQPEPAATRRLVDEVRADHRTGLPDPASLAERQYSSRLSLEAVGQPYLSSGGGPFGTFVRAGGAVMFGDMLGERRLGAAVQIGNHLRDAAFEFRFLNQARRWNWGAVAELEPGLRRYRRTAAIEHDGDPALLKQADYLERVQLRTAAVVAYPFNRGLRLELSGGIRHAMYHREVRSQISSSATGRILATDRVTTPGGEPTTVAEVGAALVHDTTVFGLTGPILGSRYRFEVAPAVGELAYTRVVADYRRYLVPVRPYSVAVRVLHSARYGPDSDDPRLMSSFLGSNALVRGHRLDLRFCPPDPARVCGDELLGSRLLVSNLEVRVPLWGVFSRQFDYGRVPADLFVFADGGLVWSRQGRTANGISSVGAGIRLNAGGLPFEVAAIRALDGPQPGWRSDFGFRLGF